MKPAWVSFWIPREWIRVLWNTRYNPVSFMNFGRIAISRHWQGSETVELFLLISISTDSPNWIFLTSVIDLKPKLGVSAKLLESSKCYQPKNRFLDRRTGFTGLMCKPARSSVAVPRAMACAGFRSLGAVNQIYLAGIRKEHFHHRDQSAKARQRLSPRSHRPPPRKRPEPPERPRVEYRPRLTHRPIRKIPRRPDLWLV